MDTQVRAVSARKRVPGDQKAEAGPRKKVDRGVTLMQCLSHEVRFNICVLLREGEKSVSELCGLLSTPQHKVSQQLAILRNAGIVEPRRQSRRVFYSLVDRKVEGCLSLLLADPRGPLTAEAFEAGRFADMGERS